MTLTEDFKGVMSCWASGVTVVTTDYDSLVYGITVSSFASLSIDPVLVVVCLANTNRISQMVQDAGTFGVSLLAAGQQDVSKYFSTGGREPVPEFESVRTHTALTGAPLVTGAIGHLDCELEAALPGGDHTIAIGRVIYAAYDPDLQPLLYFRRNYHTLPGA
ncbi:MAG: flavin reductase family protein [Tepidiformaceae bacterium]